jgi:hypothetical protein
MPVTKRPVVALSWRDDYLTLAEAPPEITATLHFAGRLHGDSAEALPVIILDSPATSATAEEVDHRSQQTWNRLEPWLDAILPGTTVQVVVRAGDPFTELTDELSTAPAGTTLLLASGAEAVASRVNELIGRGISAVWLNPPTTEILTILTPIVPGEPLAPLLRNAVDLALRTQGRILFAAATPTDESDEAVEQYRTELVKTLSHFDYRIIAGGVRLELFRGDLPTVLKKLIHDEKFDVVLWPDDCRKPNLREAIQPLSEILPTTPN